MRIRVNIDIDTDDQEDRFLLEDILYTLQQLRGDTDDTRSEGEEESS